jgi:hypothetical protein
MNIFRTIEHFARSETIQWNGPTITRTIKSRLSGIQEMVRKIQRNIWELRKKLKIGINPNEFAI